ncbi:hypothetical protein D9M70_622330 [compost metagenome]
MVVDGLARHAGFGGDLVDGRAGKALPAEHLGCRLQDRDAFRQLSFLHAGVRRGEVMFFHRAKIEPIDDLDNAV